MTGFAVYEMDMPDDFDGQSNFLAEPGTYHVVVTAVDESPTAKNGTLIDGFRVEFAVLDGTVAGQKDKQFDLLFFKPKLTDKNNGEFAKRKQARFAIATGILPKAEPGQRVTVDLEQAMGRQLVVELEHQKDQTTGQPTKFLQLAWANIYHVDDPAVAKVPKDAVAIGLLPAELRKNPEEFARQPTGKGNGSPRQAVKPTAEKVPAGGVNLDDL